MTTTPSSNFINHQEHCWSNNIKQQLQQRNGTIKQIEGVFSSYNILLQQNKSLKSRNAVLNEKNTHLRKRNNELSRDVINKFESTKSSSEYVKTDLQNFKIRELEQKINSLQSELTEVYREKSQQAQQTLEIGKELRKYHASNDKLQIQINELEKSVSQLKIERSDLRNTIEKKIEAMEFLDKDLKSLHDELRSRDHKIDELREENKNMLERILIDKHNYAEKMNDITAEMNDIQQQRKEWEQKYYEQCQYLQQQQQQQDEKKEEEQNELKKDENQRESTTLERLFGRRNSKSSNIRISAPMSPSSSPSPSSSFSSSSSSLSSLQNFNAINCPSTLYLSKTGHNADLNSVAFSFRGGWFATASNDRTVKLWDSFRGDLKSTLEGSTSSVMHVVFSSEGRYVLGTSSDAAARIWVSQSSYLLHTLTGHTAKIYAGDFTPHTKHVVTGSYDRTLKLWDLHRGACIKTAICFSSCNDLHVFNTNIASAHFDGFLRIWDTRGLNTISDMENAKGFQTTSVDVSADGCSVLTAARDHTLRIIDLRTGRVRLRLSHPCFRNSVSVNKAALSPCGKYVAAGSNNGNVLVWSAEDGKILHVLDRHKSSVSCCAWSAEGSILASCSHDHQFIWWT